MELIKGPGFADVCSWLILARPLNPLTRKIENSGLVGWDALVLFWEGGPDSNLFDQCKVDLLLMRWIYITQQQVILEQHWDKGERTKVLSSWSEPWNQSSSHVLILINWVNVVGGTFNIAGLGEKNCILSLNQSVKRNSDKRTYFWDKPTHYK